jgi:tetratricopeptide (TPR) repeat protein
MTFMNIATLDGAARVRAGTLGGRMQVALTPRARVVASVGAAAAVAAAAVVGLTLLQTRGQSTVPAGAVTKPRAGYPKLELFFGVRGDAEARALARAQSLYDSGKVARAAAVFARYHSLEAQIGAAFADWKHGGLGPVRRLAAAHPTSALVQLHLGLADYWAGRNADALAAWERTARLGADSAYGVAAEDLLHPALKIPGLPPIVADVSLPKAAVGLPEARQLRLLRRDAEKPNPGAKLLYGLILWNLRRPLSAERQLAAAAALAPDDPVVRTAAAVALYSKADPTRAFARLGPLSGAFPHAAVVRLHLGLLLLWDGERKKAASQLRLAIADEPHTVYAKEAKTLLASLVDNGTK